MGGWIGVDLDGTLAEYHGFGNGEIGAPIAPMVERVQNWIMRGRTVKIMTARAAVPDLVPPVVAWCEEHIGHALEVTNIKDFQMIELWDDRAIQVIPNTGKRADGKD